MKEKTEIYIKGEYIELFKLLKFAGLVNDGSEAKMLIENGEVLYNNEVETRKRKKVYSGDVVILGNNLLYIKKEEK